MTEPRHPAPPPDGDAEPRSFDTGLRPDELDADRPRLLVTPWGELALYVVLGRVVAADAFCPHLLGPLFQGSLTGREVVCPWHGWRFSLLSGERTDAPTADRIRVLPCRLGPRGTLCIDAPADAGRRPGGP